MSAVSEFFHKFFTYQYLFGPTLPNISRSDYVILYLGAFLLLAGIVLFILTARFKREDLRRRLWMRRANFDFYIGLALVVWFGLRYELIDYFSAHIVWVLIVIAGIIWNIFIVKYQFGDYARQKKELEREALKQKYL